MVQVAAEAMLSQVIYWIRVDDGGLGLAPLCGNPPSEELGRPMMLLNILTEFCGSDSQLRIKYTEDFDWAVAAILKHVSRSAPPPGPLSTPHMVTPQY